MLAAEKPNPLDSSKPAFGIFKESKIDTNEKIKSFCDYLREFLIEKNVSYNDSLQNPIGVFQNDKLQGILGRIDDKLNRIKKVGINDNTEDTILDLIGYLVHLKIMLNEKK